MQIPVNKKTACMTIILFCFVLQISLPVVSHVSRVVFQFRPPDVRTDRETVSIRDSLEVYTGERPGIDSASLCRGSDPGVTLPDMVSLACHGTMTTKFVYILKANGQDDAEPPEAYSVQTWNLFNFDIFILQPEADTGNY